MNDNVILYYCWVMRLCCGSCLLCESHLQIVIKMQNLKKSVWVMEISSEIND